MRWVLFWSLMVVAVMVQVENHFDWAWPTFTPKPFSEPGLPTLTEADERNVRGLIEYHWPTAGQTASLKSLHLVWSEGNARVAHVVLAVRDGSGAMVKETRLISFRITDENHVNLSESWAMPTCAGFDAAHLDSALKANRFGPYQRVVRTTVIDGVRYDIHDDGTSSLTKP